MNKEFYKILTPEEWERASETGIIETDLDIKDGFKLSEIDLEIRGEGKVTGTSQSGQSDLKIADLRYDYELLLKSKEIFEEIDSVETKELIFKEAKVLFPNYFKADGTT